MKQLIGILNVIIQIILIGGGVYFLLFATPEKFIEGMVCLILASLYRTEDRLDDLSV